MRYLLLTLAALTLVVSTARPQSEQKSAGISFSGFVKTDLFYDTRETVSLREGHFLLYPAEERSGEDDADLNAAASLNMLSIQTRLKGDITGPDAFSAKTSGCIEGEFFGTSDGDINGFRLRHAFVKLDWGNSALLVGQTWHPMFVAEVFPGVVSFNTGAPFQPFSRNPQVRFTQTIGGLRLIGVAATQRDFQSMGPDATGGSAISSSAFLRHAVLPNLHLQAQYRADGHVFGAGVDYKQLMPRLVIGEGRVSEETVTGMSLIGYAKIDASPFTLKAEGVLGQNLADLLQFGGYAVTSVDPEAGTVAYSTMDSYSVWGEVIYGKDLEAAVFAGYSENLGADENPCCGVYARGSSIANLFRVSPRIQYTAGKVRVAAELEYTAAAYGSLNTLNKGLVEDAETVANTRVLVAMFYFF